MRLISTKSFTLFGLIAATLTLAACGNKTSSIRSAETEGIFLNVGQLKYQVQISRQLNPQAIAEDQTFIQDIVPSEAKLAPGELWFAVFVRIENDTDKAQTPATSYTIIDTEGNTYSPVHFGKGNPFAYTTAPIPRKSEIPSPDSVSAQVGSIGGQELLFKLKRAALDNRPLELRIKSFFPDDEATGSLDV
jgi:hypothetical protein